MVPDCTAEIESIIQRMLRKQAGERYQGMEDVLLDLEPVWNRLRLSAAAMLAERAREFYDLGDLPTAYDTLRRARQIDSSNTEAKSLLEKISSEIRRTEIQPKVQEHLSRGRELLQAGQFREAQAEAEAALGLDSRHEPAQKLLAEVEAAGGRSPGGGRVGPPAGFRVGPKPSARNRAEASDRGGASEARETQTAYRTSAPCPGILDRVEV
jgi:tetratricopeptide (TPR) repeat protein